jgi:hypothetical protein
MTADTLRRIAAVAALIAGLASTQPALAFRCGSKLVTEGMHEQQVVSVCGQPATRRILGHALRSPPLTVREHLAPGWTRSREFGYGSLAEEVIITEYVYNFGPRKLMRRLLFEGGALVSIEPIGYGYRED